MAGKIPSGEHYPDFRWDLSLEQAAKDYVDFHDRMGDFPLSNEAIFDDRLIRAWKDCSAHFTAAMAGNHQK